MARPFQKFNGTIEFVNRFGDAPFSPLLCSRDNKPETPGIYLTEAGGNPEYSNLKLVHENPATALQFIQASYWDGEYWRTAEDGLIRNYQTRLWFGLRE